MGLAHRGCRGRLGNRRHGVWERGVRSSRREEEVSRHPPSEGSEEEADERGGIDVRLKRREEQGHRAPGLRHFVQPTRLFARRALLVATVYPAQRPHSARTGGAVRAREKRSRDDAVRESADSGEWRLLDVAWSFFWSRRRNAELDRCGRGALGERCPR